jgi:hypothetical protein
MGRFWMDDDVVRVHAKNLELSDLAVYAVLCCFANDKGETYIGVRKIASLLGINKETVVNALRRLVVYGLTVRFPRKKGQVYGLQIKSVRINPTQVSGSAVHKEVFKEYIKEGEISSKTENIRSQIRDKFGWSQP